MLCTNRIPSSSMLTALGSVATPGSCSTRRTVTPAPPSALAIARPVGPPPTTSTSTCSVVDMLEHHVVRDRANTADLDPHPVPWAEQHLRIALEADAGGRAHEDDIAGYEVHELRKQRDGFRHVENHLACVGVLELDAVKLKTDLNVAGIADLVTRHNPQAEGRRARPRFPVEPLVARRQGWRATNPGSAESIAIA